jgi:hypothetical protein
MNHILGSFEQRALVMLSFVIAFFLHANHGVWIRGWDRKPHLLEPDFRVLRARRKRILINYLSIHFAGQSAPIVALVLIFRAYLNARVDIAEHPERFIALAV